MAIPDFQTCMLPALRLIADGKSHQTKDIFEQLCDEFKLTAEERERLVPSGAQRLIFNRVGWAITYMRQAELLNRLSRGIVQITERGREVLASKPEKLSKKYLLRFPEF